MKHIYRFELLPHESNKKAMNFYLQNNFKIESTSKYRVLGINNNFEDEIKMVWFNKNFNQDSLSSYCNFLSQYIKKLYDK